MPRTHIKKWSAEECLEKHKKNMQGQKSFRHMIKSKRLIRKNFLKDTALRVITKKVEKLFKDINPEDRETFKFLNKEGAKNMRDALWFGFEEDGYLPHYRTASSSYGRPEAPIRKMDATKPAPKWLQYVARKMEKISGHKKNHFVIHRYFDENDKIGAHHDKTQDLSIGSSIFCLSLGSSRKFRITANKKDKWLDHNLRADFKVKPNYCVQLPWDINQVYRHEIVPCKKYREVRYSITARSKCTMYNPETKHQKIINTKLN